MYQAMSQAIFLINKKKIQKIVTYGQHIKNVGSRKTSTEK